MRSIGDGMTALALAGGIIGYFYVIHQSRQKKIEIIHKERLLAMEKGIPLPEFPFEPDPNRERLDPTGVIPILGVVLFSLALGSMIMLYVTLEGDHHSLWVAPLPFAFLGMGLIVFHLLKSKVER